MSGHPPPSLNTGAYAKARQRLPETVLQQLFEHTGAVLSERAEANHLWLGHAVKVLDGTTVTLADTEANQHAYPQHPNQKPGCGFPLVQLVVMFSLTTAAAIGVRIAPWKTSEIGLARQWYATLQPDDVVVADRAYGSYVDLALLLQQRAHGVLRQRHHRCNDWTKGKRLGSGDYQFCWKRPQSVPKSMNRADFEALPPTLAVRVIQMAWQRPGWRTQSVMVVTTLLDAKVYPKAQIATLYGLRWRVEVNLRHLKTTLRMEHLLGQSPEMVRKEIYVHLLAYNLLRYLIWQAASDTEQDPWRLSLQGTRQSFNHFRPHLSTAEPDTRANYCRYLLEMVAQMTVPERPSRFEPRCLKRRPKDFSLMREPREILKQNLLHESIPP